MPLITRTVPNYVVNFTKLQGECGRILDWDLRRVMDGKMTCVVSKFAASQQEKKKHNKNNR